jgi:hypothetical protein
MAKQPYSPKRVKNACRGARSPPPALRLFKGSVTARQDYGSCQASSPNGPNRFSTAGKGLPIVPMCKNMRFVGEEWLWLTSSCRFDAAFFFPMARVVTRQQTELVRRQKRAVGTPRFRWGLLWWQIRCVHGRRSIRCTSQRSKWRSPLRSAATVS